MLVLAPLWCVGNQTFWLEDLLLTRDIQRAPILCLCKWWGAFPRVCSHQWQTHAGHQGSHRCRERVSRACVSWGRALVESCGRTREQPLKHLCRLLSGEGAQLGQGAVLSAVHPVHYVSLCIMCALPNPCFLHICSLWVLPGVLCGWVSKPWPPSVRVWHPSARWHSGPGSADHPAWNGGG